MNRKWPSRLVQLATVLVVAAVAAGTFVLSYSGVHAIALESGVSARLARYYPAVFDAVLVIACAAAPLRDARWWTRLYTWLVILLVIGVLGAMDAVHAMNVALPRRQAEGVVSVLPWVLLLLAFSLWLVILRHYRVQAASQDASQAAAPATGAATGEQPALPAQPGWPALPAADGDEPEAGPAPEPGSGPATGAAPGEPAAEPSGADAGEEPGRADSPDAPPDAEAAAEGTPQPAPSDEAAGQSGPDEIDAIPGMTYATGPRLRRVRSLPAPPVDDE
jgi:hypothetical protein